MNVTVHNLYSDSMKAFSGSEADVRQQLLDTYTWLSRNTADNGGPPASVHQCVARLNGAQALMVKVEDKDEIDTLLDHPNVHERSMALRLSSAKSKHVSHAALDPHPIVHQAAIDHVHFDSSAGLRLMESDTDHAGNYPLDQKLYFLTHPDKAQPHHLTAALRHVPNAPPEAREHLHEALAMHPGLQPGHVRALYLDPAVQHHHRQVLFGHPAIPDDVLHHAINTGMLNPSDTAAETAEAALAHPQAHPGLVEAAIRLGMESMQPGPKRLALHALARANVPAGTIDYIIQRTKLHPDAHHFDLLAAALQGPNATAQHVDETLNFSHPFAIKAVLGARPTNAQHLTRIQALLAPEQPLEKAINPKHFTSVVRALDPAGAKLVDHKPHLNAHPPGIDHEVQAYRTHVLDSPKKARKIGKDGFKEMDLGHGVTKKVAYDVKIPGNVDSNRFLIKPYHERIFKKVKTWMQHPHQGWAEMANQGLFHAAGIGHLHQKVHVSEHNFGDPMHEKEPALVVHLEPGFKQQYDSDGLAGHPWMVKTKEEHEAAGGVDLHQDVRKIAMMDMLTNNQDRHAANILQSHDGKRLLAIDHSRNFQYAAPRNEADKWEDQTENDQMTDTFGDYHKESNGIQQASPFFSGKAKFYDKQMDAMEAYAPIFDWWGTVSGKVKEEMGKHLQQIQDPDVRNHIARNFHARADWLDERAKLGLDNYGTDWYNDPILMYHPHQRTDEEEREAEWRGESVNKSELKQSLTKLLAYVKTTKAS